MESLRVSGPWPNREEAFRYLSRMVQTCVLPLLWRTNRAQGWIAGGGIMKVGKWSNTWVVNGKMNPPWTGRYCVKCEHHWDLIAMHAGGAKPCECNTGVYKGPSASNTEGDK